MATANGENDMDKNEILRILETAKDENGEVPMRLVRQAFEKLPEPCEDAVSRQDAIDAVEKESQVDGAYGYMDTKSIIDLLCDLPSAQQEQRWIPCSERFPNTNGIYIVTRRMSDGFECRNITDACYFDGSNIWHDDTRVNHERKYLTDVIAWCELPEPYKEGTDD